MGRPSEYDWRDAVDCFEGRDDPCEPLFTREIADAMGCSHVTALKALKTAAEMGELRKKERAQVIVWWRPGDGSEAGRGTS